jgi:hypothetical protein
MGPVWEASVRRNSAALNDFGYRKSGEGRMGGKYSAEWWRKIAEAKRETPSRSEQSIEMAGQASAKPITAQPEPVAVKGSAGREL